MDLLLAGFAGVLLGALIAAAIILHCFQKRADRDLIERRLRACFDYRDSLGDLESAFQNAESDPEILSQAWRNVALLCREFRRTSWLFAPAVRHRLAAVVDDLERERRHHEANGADSGGRIAQLLCEKGRELERLLEAEMAAEAREHRRLRFLPGYKKETNS